MNKKHHDEFTAEREAAGRPSSMTEDGQFTSEDVGERHSVIRELIARRAYELYQKRGGIDGEEINDWLRAEAEVRALLGMSDQEMSDMAPQRRQANSRSAK